MSISLSSFVLSSINFCYRVDRMLGTVSVDMCNFYLVVQLYLFYITRFRFVSYIIQLFQGWACLDTDSFIAFALFCATSGISRFIALLFTLSRIIVCYLPKVLFARFDCCWFRLLFSFSYFSSNRLFLATFPCDFSTTSTLQLSFGTLYKDTYLYNKLCSR